jgi:predicted NACHT family NTPase
LAQRRARRDRSPDAVPPEQVRELWLAPADAGRAAGGDSLATELKRGGGSTLDALPNDAPLRLALTRPELVSEALAQVSRLVLLGAPGNGKSTALRYISLQLARHHLDPDNVPAPFGWTHAPIPIFCPLGLVASALSRARPEQSDVAVFWETVAARLGDDTIRPGLAQHLFPALRPGAALVLLDGLDEIAATPNASGVSLRLRVSRAVQTALRQLPRRAPVVLTCRIVPYQQPGGLAVADEHVICEDWRLPADDGWQVRTLQPFAFGQVRRFVERWYAAACAGATAMYPAAIGAQRADSLLAQLVANERLRRLVESPLLLTMLAILHSNRDDGNLPRDRARLYDECVQLLIERWEPRPPPEQQVPGRLERLEIAQLATTDDLRAVVHQVALAAHNRPPDPGDGRGMLRGARSRAS